MQSTVSANAFVFTGRFDTELGELQCCEVSIAVIAISITGSFRPFETQFVCMQDIFPSDTYPRIYP